jgi:hypothetical protein
VDFRGEKRGRQRLGSLRRRNKQALVRRRKEEDRDWEF